MNSDFSHMGAHGPLTEHPPRNKEEADPKYTLGIATLLGLNSPRGTSLGVPSQNCIDEINPYKISAGTDFSFDEGYAGGGATMPPSPPAIARKKPYFETSASPEYSYNTETMVPKKMRNWAGTREDSPILDNYNSLRMVGTGSSDSPAGSGMGTPSLDHPFDDNITNAMGRMKLGYYVYGNNNIPDYDLTTLQGCYGGLPTGPIINSSLLHQMNQMHAKQQQQQYMLNQIFDEGWASHQYRTGISLEKAARVHRSSAAMCNATCSWSGTLPQRSMHKPTAQFSCKVFLGGVPWDITESMLIGTFHQFGNARIEWPGKESDTAILPKGYVYIIFENDKQVKSLLQACIHDHFNGGSWYYRISSRKMKAKEVQVIPWLLSDSNCVKAPSQKLDPQKTVFVGALHGMLNAEGLCHIMDELFGNVVYAGIDTDKFKYPIGSGRVTFSDSRSYMRAVAAAFIDIKTARFAKKVQVDPYLEDALCSVCHIQQGPYFCREMTCFRYFCRICWQCSHSAETVCNHRPLMRNSKSGPSMLGFSAGARSSK